jgi:hypothetical protein
MKNVQANGVFTPALMLPTLILAASLCASASGKYDASPASLPIAAQSSVSAVLGRDTPSYRAKLTKEGFTATNLRQKLTTRFTAAGVEIKNGNARWKISLRGYGYGDAIKPVVAAPPHASSNRVEYRCKALTEWYVNGPVGLEQGLTIAESPGKANGQPLTIASGLSGNMAATVDRNGRSLSLAENGGRTVLRYAGLTASDADGKDLHAWLKLRGKELLLQVEDAGARYPVSIDPIIQLAELTASDGLTNTGFGYPVAVSGNTLVVGGAGGDGELGAAYVFVKPATGWANMTETAELTASDAQKTSSVGISVAISGNTIVVGLPCETIDSNQFQGSAYVFVEPTGGWTNMTQTAELTASDGGAGNFFGLSVAIGKHIIVVGSPDRASSSPQDSGAAYVFVEPKIGWRHATQTAKLTASDGVVQALLGSAVAINAGGDTVMVGAPLAHPMGTITQGAVYVFVEPPSGWADATQIAELSSFENAGTDGLGGSLSIQGNTVVAGAGDSYDGTGAVYVFVEPSGGWTNMTETAQLTALGGSIGDGLGSSVVLYGDVILAGALGATVRSNRDQGEVYIYREPGNGWTTTSNFNAKFTASDGVAYATFGNSVAASSTVFVGAQGQTVNGVPNVGATYVFSLVDK